MMQYDATPHVLAGAAGVKELGSKDEAHELWRVARTLNGHAMG